MSVKMYIFTVIRKGKKKMKDKQRIVHAQEDLKIG